MASRADNRTKFHYFIVTLLKGDIFATFNSYFLTTARCNSDSIAQRIGRNGRKVMKNTFKPRDMINKEVAGICGVARLTDKARAAQAEEIGNYKYGADSKQDSGILSFLGISADAFQEAAVRIDNDVKLGAWILDNCNRSDEEISEFNRQFVSWWKKNYSHDYLPKRRKFIKEDKHLSLGGCLLECILWLIFIMSC